MLFRSGKGVGDLKEEEEEEKEGQAALEGAAGGQGKHLVCWKSEKRQIWLEHRD